MNKTNLPAILTALVLLIGLGGCHNFLRSGDEVHIYQNCTEEVNDVCTKWGPTIIKRLDLHYE